MWADRETNNDLLGTTHLKDIAIQISRDPSLLPVTIGIFGDWGSGKSSLINMISKELKEDHTSLVIPFNGWLFENYEDAKTALIETIIETIVENSPSKKGKELKEAGLRLIKKINWFKVAGKAVQYGATALATGGIGLVPLALSDLPNVAKKAGEVLENINKDNIDELFKSESDNSLSKNIRSFRKEFEKLVELSEFNSVIITIDDLDRCLPNSVIETLEAIKLFLYAPKTSFIIAADERIVKYAVKSRFPELPGDKSEVGRDYLEKLIQYQIHIPAMTQNDTENYITLLLIQDKLDEDDFKNCIDWVLDSKTIEEARILTFNEIETIIKTKPESIREDLAFSQRIGPILGLGLNGNPRQCKRFLNTLSIRMKMAESRNITLERRVLSKLMILEYFRPQQFRKLHNWQSQQEGMPKEFKVFKEILSDEKDTDSQKSKEIDLWLKDDWICKWLDMEPELTGKDLRPYFYFSRENIFQISTASTSRLSAEAQSILKELYNKSEAIRNTALDKSSSLSEIDATGILSEIIKKGSTEEDFSDENGSLGLSVCWVNKRPELISELMSFLNTIPDTDLPIWIITKLESILCPDRITLFTDFLNRIIESSDAGTPIKSAARLRLKKLN